VTIGLALSGGGARGDFEVGAVRYLYDHGVVPDIICGTSVGAINGAKLAEGEGAPDQGLPGLEAIWLSLRTNSDMYLEERWLNEIDPRMKEAFTGHAPIIAGPQPHTYYRAWGDIGSLLEAVDKASWMLTDGAAILLAFEALSKARALYNLSPIQRKLAAQLDQRKIESWSQGGSRKLRLGIVGLESGALRYVTESGEILERDGNSKLLITTETLAPECARITAEISALESQKQDLQEDLSGAAPGMKGVIGAQIRKLHDQIMQRRAAFDVCIREHPPTRATAPLKVSVADGVLASAVMPGIFPPVRLGGEHYVDGGVREILPLKAAADLGADTIYGIAGSKSGIGYKPVFDKSSLIEIVARSVTEIAINEVALNETHPDIGWGGRTVRIIQPTFDLHDVTTIDPGLIRISMGYGYMRAADIVESADDLARQAAFPSSDTITRLRHQNYVQEDAYFKVTPESAEGLRLRDELRARKTALRNQVRARLVRGLSVPPFGERWWLNWEWPPKPQAASSPWQRFAGDSVPVACQPIKSELGKLSLELDILLDRQEREPHKPPPPPSLTRQVAAKRAAVAAKSAELDTCVRQHPLSSSYGVLIKGTGPSVFIVYGGAKLWIRSPAAMNALHYDWNDIQRIPDATLAQMPNDRPADCTLLKRPTDPKVYVILGGERCWVTSPAVFDRKSFSRAEIRTVPDDTLAAIPAGPDVT
jgi:predicted acylesterase/phospholipase RssA